MEWRSAVRRLTEYHPDGHVVLKDQTGHGLAAALERLAAYEDSGIIPQVAQTWSQMYDEGTLVLACRPRIYGEVQRLERCRSGRLREHLF